MNSSRAKTCVKSAQEKWGKRAWGKLTPDMREAFVCRELVYMMLGQGKGAIEADGFHVLTVLLDDCRQALGGIE